MLTEVDLGIAPGEMVGIVGANGSGKSTLLRIIAGLSRPTRGRVVGAPTVGYLPDRFPAAQRHGGRRYLAHMAAIGGQSVGSQIDSLLDRLHLVGGENTPMRLLSKGNAQKIGLAQALIGDPQLLVLDEPWSGLDVQAHGVLADLIEGIRHRGGAVVAAEHDRGAVAGLSDRVLEVAGGAVRPTGQGPGRPDRSGAAGHRAQGPVQPGGQPIGPTIRIDLAGGRIDGLDAIDGVLHVETGRQPGGLTVLTVDPGRSDAVLAAALERGCSVRGLRPW